MNGGGNSALKSLQTMVKNMVVIARNKEKPVEPRSLKTHWREGGFFKEPRPLRRNTGRYTARVLPPVEAAAEEEKVLGEFDFLDRGPKAKAEWQGTERPIDEVWGERWDELRYLWERMRTEYHHSTLITAKKLRSADRVNEFELIRTLMAADTMSWVGPVYKRFFVSQFLGYLSADPYIIGDHLEKLWATLDVEGKGSIDFRELACLMRILTHPEEAPQEKFLWFFDVFRQRTRDQRGGAIKPYMLRHYLLFILGAASATDAEAARIAKVMPDLERAIGYPVPRAIHRDRMVLALEKCPVAMAEFGLQCLARLPRKRRLRALAHHASKTSSASQWEAMAPLRARIRAAEEAAEASARLRRGIPKKRGRRRSSTFAVPVGATATHRQAKRVVADAWGVPVTLHSHPRNRDSRNAGKADLYTLDRSEALLRRYKPREGAEINSMRAIAYSTAGQVAAMQGLKGVKLRLRRAGLAAILARVPYMERKRFIFDHWRKRSAAKMERNETQNMAYEYYVNRTLIKYLRYWAFRGRLRAAKRLAIKMGNRRRKKLIIEAFVKYKEAATMQRINLAAYKNSALRRMAMQTQLSEADRNEIFASVWLPKGFAGIKWAARINRLSRAAGELRKWRLKYNCFTTWKRRAERRIKYKNERRIERKVERHAEADRREAEEAAERAAEAARVAAEKEAAEREAAWKAKIKKAEEYFDLRRSMEILAEKQEKRRVQAQIERERRFDEFFDKIIAQRYEKVREEGEMYLLQDKQGKQYYSGFIREMEEAVHIKERVDESVERWQNGFVWKVQYDRLMLARSFVHVETGQRVYSKYEKGVDKKLKATKALMKRIALENYIGRKRHESGHLLAQRRKKELALELREYSSGVIAKTWKSFKYGRMLMAGIKALLVRAHAQQDVEAELHRHRMAAKIQNTWRAKGTQSMLADLVWSLWAIKSDPSDNSTYYMNRLSGAVQTHPPAILRSRLVGNIIRNIDLEPDWILVEVPKHERGVTHYYNQRLKEKRFKPPMGYYMCADCDRYRFATRFCPQCGDHYCLVCYRRQHKKGGRAQHAWIPVPVKPVYCKNCNKRKALYKCFECNMPLCHDCNLEFHHEESEWHFHDVIEM